MLGLTIQNSSDFLIELLKRKWLLKKIQFSMNSSLM